MEIRMEHAIERPDGTIDVLVHLDIDPGYAPYPTSDRNHPAFADPGEPEICDIISVRTLRGTPIRVTDLRDYEIADIETLAWEHYENICKLNEEAAAADEIERSYSWDG